MNLRKGVEEGQPESDPPPLLSQTSGRVLRGACMLEWDMKPQH